MPARRQLRAVPDDAKPAARPKAPTVAEAAATGSHRALLVAMRERIARTVSDPQCPPRDLAALTRRLQDIAREIEGLDARAAEEGTAGGDVDDEAFDAEAL